VRAVAPAQHDRVIEVATGPGYVAMGFAAVCREVVGLDLTKAAFVIAARIGRERGLSNPRFQLRDAERLPFSDGQFDAAVCRWAFHRVADPPLVLAKVVRVTRAAGIVAVEDSMVSEHHDRAAYHNRFENLRDSSHTRGYPLSRLLTLFAAARLDVAHVSTDELTQHVEGWLAGARTPDDRATQTRALIERDEREDLSGTHPFRHNGDLCFTQRTAIVVGRKLSRR